MLFIRNITKIENVYCIFAYPIFCIYYKNRNEHVHAATSTCLIFLVAAHQRKAAVVAISTVQLRRTVVHVFRGWVGLWVWCPANQSCRILQCLSCRHQIQWFNWRRLIVASGNRITTKLYLSNLSKFKYSYFVRKCIVGFELGYIRIVQDFNSPEFTGSWP